MLVINLTMVRGDTQLFTVTCTQNGVPVNLTGYRIWMTAKYNLSDLDSAALFQASTAAGSIALTSPALGIATVTLTPAMTNSISSSGATLVYDIQIEDPGNNVTTVTTGALTITPDVTQTT